MTPRPVVHHAFQIECPLRFAPNRFRLRANVPDDVLHRLVNDPPFASDIGYGDVIVVPWGLSVRRDVPEHLQALAHDLMTDYRRKDFMVLVRYGVVTLSGADDRRRERVIDRATIDECTFLWNRDEVVLSDQKTVLHNVKAIGPEISHFDDPREAARINEAVGLMRASEKRLPKANAATRKFIKRLVCKPRLPRSIVHLPDRGQRILSDEGSARRALNRALEFVELMRPFIFSEADLAEFYARAEANRLRQSRARDTERKRKSRAAERKRKSRVGRSKGPKRRVR